MPKLCVGAARPGRRNRCLACQRLRELPFRSEIKVDAWALPEIRNGLKITVKKNVWAGKTV